MKSINIFRFIIFLVIIIIMCLIYEKHKNSDIKQIKKETGISFSDCKKVNSYNTKGSFGDGDYVVILDCSTSNDKYIKQLKKWDECPLQNLIYDNIYGNSKKGYIEYERLSTKYRIPKIDQCFYQFIDTNSESKELDGFPKNFILSIYDTKNKKLYYIDYDS